MTNLPSPADRGHLRVSDADREWVADILRESAGEGRLTLDELDQRLDQAYAAKTYAELETVTRDLPVTGVAAPSAPVFPAGRFGGTPSGTISVACMSEARRSGPWVVPSRYTAVAFMGGVHLDLRQARFSEPTATIAAFAWMGGVTIIVPEDFDVDVSGIGFMGGFDHRASGPGVPGAPRVKITGFAFMGGVEVRRKAMTKHRAEPVQAPKRPEIDD